jgi:hypothetical protein
VYESPDRPGWKVLTVSGTLSAEQFRELATQMLATAESGIPEVVVNTQGVDPPVAELAGVLHRCAELLSWSGGALIVTSPSERLVRRLHALGDSEDLVLVA